MKPIFKLPETKMCVVIWYRDGERHEQLMDTPTTSAKLIDLMLMQHHVGWSEIRGVQSVDIRELLRSAV